MTIYDLTRATAVYSTTLYTLLTIAAILAGLGVLWLSGRIGRAVAIDTIEVWTRWQSAKMDARRRPEVERLEDWERRVKLRVWQDDAKQRLSDHRLKLRAGYVPVGFIPSETDIEIEVR